MNRKPLSRIVAISPHPDDVALSTTHFLGVMRRVHAVRQLELVSCFTESQYAPFGGSGGARNVTEIRWREDLVFLKRIGFEKTSLCRLGLLDAPLRPEWQAGADVHDARQYVPGNEAEIDGYAQDLAERLVWKRDEEALSLLPLGIGHKDHFITNRAALRALRRLPLMLYEDVPYALTAPEEAVRCRVDAARATLGEPLWPVIVRHRDIRKQWIACISAYASQFTMMEVEAMADAFQARGRERLWANGRALALLQASGPGRASTPSSVDLSGS
jgi:LmbE family N-acetylglucosaminyl deacetylase